MPAGAMQADEARAELESELHVRVGIQLFSEGDYEEAMGHVGMCSRSTPVLLLTLFPSLAPRALLEPVTSCFPGVAASRQLNGSFTALPGVFLGGSVGWAWAPVLWSSGISVSSRSSVAEGTMELPSDGICTTPGTPKP